MFIAELERKTRNRRKAAANIMEAMRECARTVSVRDPEEEAESVYGFDKATNSEWDLIKAQLEATYHAIAQRNTTAIQGFMTKTPTSEEPPAGRSKIINIRQGQQLKPVFGDIAAGFPQDAIEQAEQFIAVPKEIAEKTTYVLRARGVSMVDREINDGDDVALSHLREPKNNEVQRPRFF